MIGCLAIHELADEPRGHGGEMESLHRVTAREHDVGTRSEAPMIGSPSGGHGRVPLPDLDGRTTGDVAEGANARSHRRADADVIDAFVQPGQLQRPRESQDAVERGRDDARLLHVDGDLGSPGVIAKSTWYPFPPSMGMDTPSARESGVRPRARRDDDGVGDDRTVPRLHPPDAAVGILREPRDLGALTEVGAGLASRVGDRLEEAGRLAMRLVRVVHGADDAVGDRGLDLLRLFGGEGARGDPLARVDLCLAPPRLEGGVGLVHVDRTTFHETGVEPLRGERLVHHRARERELFDDPRPLPDPRCTTRRHEPQEPRDQRRPGVHRERAIPAKHESDALAERGRIGEGSTVPRRQQSRASDGTTGEELRSPLEEERPMSPARQLEGRRQTDRAPSDDQHVGRPESLVHLALIRAHRVDPGPDSSASMRRRRPIHWLAPTVMGARFPSPRAQTATCPSCVAASRSACPGGGAMSRTSVPGRRWRRTDRSTIFAGTVENSMSSPAASALSSPKPWAVAPGRVRARSLDRVPGEDVDVRTESDERSDEQRADRSEPHHARRSRRGWSPRCSRSRRRWRPPRSPDRGGASARRHRRTRATRPRRARRPRGGRRSSGRGRCALRGSSARAARRPRGSVPARAARTGRSRPQAGSGRRRTVRPSRLRARCSPP